MNKTKKTGLKNGIGIRARGLVALALVMVLVFNINILKPKAADVSISIALSSSSVSVGSGVTATISVSGGSISAYTMYVSYNASVLRYNSGSGATVNGGGGTVVVSGTSSGAVSLSFTAVANGSSSISTSGSDFLNIDGNALSVSHAGVTVTVATAQATTTQAPTTQAATTTAQATTTQAPSNNGSTSSTSTTTEDNVTEDSSAETTEEEERSDNCNLSGLQVSPGTLEPAFSSGITSYFVQVDEDVTSMVVSAIPEDEKSTTQIWGASLIEPGENTVKITVTAENGAVKVYSIRVLAGEDKGDANVTIDDEFYKFADNQNVDGIPDGFTDTTITYKDWEVLAFKSPNKKLTIVCLIDVEGELRWFVYNEESDEFTPYQEFSSKYNRYIILAIPENSEYLDEFELTEIDIDEIKVQALYSEALNDSNLYVVYAMNIEGDEAYYLYDGSECTFMRYVAPAEKAPEVIVATPTDPATLTDASEAEPNQPDNRMVYVLIIAGGLAVLFLVLFLVMMSKYSNMKSKAQEAEDMVDSLGGGKGVDRSLLDGKKDSSVSPSTDKNDAHKGRKMDKNTSFVDAVNSMEPIRFDDETAATVNPVEPQADSVSDDGSNDDSNDVTDVAEEIQSVDLGSDDGGTIEIGYKPDEQERSFQEYADESEMINNRIMEGYDVASDSAFEDTQILGGNSENDGEDNEISEKIDDSGN